MTPNKNKQKIKWTEDDGADNHQNIVCQPILGLHSAHSSKTMKKLKGVRNSYST